MNRPCHTRAICVFEQRGAINTPAVGEGVHAHFICQRNIQNYPASTYLKCCASSFRKFVNVDNTDFYYPDWFDIKYLPDRLLYIETDGKTGEGKADKQSGDSVWRKLPAFALDDFYTNNWQISSKSFANKIAFPDIMT